MFPKFRPSRLLSRGAFAIAIAAALPMAASPVLAKDKKEAAPKGPSIKISKGYQKVAVEMQKAIEAAKKKPEVVAAQQELSAATDAYNSASGSARKAAGERREAALAALAGTVAAERSQLDAANTAATTPDDNYIGGQFAVQLGVIAQDRVLIRKGYEAMLDSGLHPAAEVPVVQDQIGKMCFDTKDFACSIKYLTLAMQGGKNDDNSAILLAEAYLQSNQEAQGLTALQAAIARKEAAGSSAPESWYRRGLGVAYKIKRDNDAAAFANGLVRGYPTKANWAGAISVLRLVSNYEIQERLDLLRLMQRTHSFTEGNDYAEFIQAADPRRLPAEVLPVLEEGIKAGKLKASDVFVSEARTEATSRVAQERPTLPDLEKSVQSPKATAVSVAATADAFLSYGEAAKAEAMYRLALEKGGADVQRVQTRIGIAQFDQGKYADAAQTFATIEGIRAPLAKLWIILSEQKAKGL